jgi:hypothetical protein
VRFLETHDEVRASVALPWDRHKAAAVLANTVPGLSLFHDGQFEGRRIKIPVQLRRRPAEPLNNTICDFYTELLRTISRDTVLRHGSWSLLEARPASSDNPTWRNFISYLWSSIDRQLRLVVVNFGQTRGQCYIHLESAGIRSDAGEVEFRDIIPADGGARYRYSLERVLREGLYLDMPSFSFHIFVVQPQPTQLTPKRQPL